MIASIVSMVFNVRRRPNEKNKYMQLKGIHSHAMDKYQKQPGCFSRSPTIFFIAVWSSIPCVTLTHRLIILLNVASASIVANKCCTRIYDSIARRAFITSVTFAMIWASFINTCTIIAWDSSTWVLTEKQTKPCHRWDSQSKEKETMLDEVN